MVAPWELEAEKIVHDGHLRVAKRRCRRPGGESGDHEVLLHGPVACVLALTPDERVVLVRQYRPGPGRVLYDLPVGFVEDGESPEEAAGRELAEETGFAGRLRKVAALSNQGYSDEVRHVFVAEGAARRHEPRPDPGEDIEVEVVDLTRARRLLRTGQFTVTDAAYVALDAAGRLC